MALDSKNVKEGAVYQTRQLHLLLNIYRGGPRIIKNIEKELKSVKGFGEM